MRTRKAFATLMICAMSALTISDALSPHEVKAQSAAQGVSNTQSPVCTNATLKGLYGYKDSGFRGTQAPFIPFNAVRTANFDGNGNLKGHGYLSQAGVIWAYTTTGTYKVENDCTVTITNTVVLSDGTTSEASSQFGVIVDQGRKILQIQTQLGSSESGSYEKAYDTLVTGNLPVVGRAGSSQTGRLGGGKMGIWGNMGTP
jgi:hypothetical protein